MLRIYLSQSVTQESENAPRVVWFGQFLFRKPHQSAMRKPLVRTSEPPKNVERVIYEYVDLWRIIQNLIYCVCTKT